MSPTDRLTDLLALPEGPVTLAGHDTAAKPGFKGGKAEGQAALAALDRSLDAVQEMLFAQGRSGGSRRILLVLQGMDTSGKGGVIRHAVALTDPQGVHIKAFGRPTEEELAHDFLWRIRKDLPGPGLIGIFDRSHYEDVLIGRVRELAPPEEIERRYDAINDFEAELVDSGTAVVKCMLHISADEQKKRLLARLEDPTKHWKFKPGDIDERKLWSSYQRAYEIALERTNTQLAPWLVVPSDRKWYRNWAVGKILLEALESLRLSWPVADFDVKEQIGRLTEEGTES